MKKCEKGNVYQHWECMRSPDGSRARLLMLRVANFGGFLSTKKVFEYRSTTPTVMLVVSGNNEVILCRLKGVSTDKNCYLGLNF